MARFRASYVDQSGATKVAWIEGPSAHWVFAHLAQKNARQISVLEDHLAPDLRDLDGEAAFAQLHAARPVSVPESSSTARTDLAGFIDSRLALPAPKRAPTPRSAAFGWLLLSAAMAMFARPLALAVLVMGGLAVAPRWLEYRVRHARAWRDWPAVLRFTAIAAWHPMIRSVPALRYIFGTLRAAALAGTGRLEEGLALVDRVGRQNRQPESVIDMAKAGVYLAVNRYDEGIALRRRAGSDPARPAMKVDLAVALLEYRRDVEGAREQLEKVSTGPTSLAEAAFRSLALGLLDIEEGRPTNAVASLTRARAAFKRDAALSMIEGILLWTDPFLCLALAQAGDKERASAMLPRVTRYLLATSQPEWLQRCREALAE